MNRSHATDAIVLKTNRIGEIHRGLVLLSREEGLVRAIAHGANSARGKLRGSTVPFCAGRVYLYTNPATDSTKVTDMDATAFHVGIRSDLKKFYVASLWAEIILKSYAGGGAADEVYTLLLSSLAVLDLHRIESCDLVSIQFVWRYLGFAGSRPDLERCACCGEFLDQDQPARFVRAEGGFCSEFHGCSPPGDAGDSAMWSAGAIGYLRHSGELSLADAMRVTPPAAAVAAMKNVLYAVIQDLVETPLNTMAVGGGIL